MKRLEDVSNSWLRNALVNAIGGFTSPDPGTRVVFCRDTFEHPDLASHDYRQDHLAPNLKGRPRKKRLKARKDMESDSNDSDFTPGRDEKAIRAKEEEKTKVRRKVLRPNKDKVSAEEESFLSNLIRFMKERKTPIDRIPSLGFKQIDLYYFYNYAQKLGGYEQITQRRMWKHLYDKLGGNPGSTSAATCTRRHYERLLLAFERYQKGEKDTGPLQLPDDYDERCENKSDDPDIITIPDNDDDEIPQKNNVFKGLEQDDSMIYMNDKARVNHNSGNIQKNILSEQSSNHFAQKSQELGARRTETKENGSVSQASMEVLHNRPIQNVAVMQREPNVVMVVSKNGDIVRANRGAPSIMKKSNTPQMLTPQGVPVAFVHQAHHHHAHHSHHHHLHHPHHKQVSNQTAAHSHSQHRSQYPNQASAHQHKPYPPHQQSRPAHLNAGHLQQRPSVHHPHPPPCSSKASSSGGTSNTGAMHVMGGVAQVPRVTPRPSHLPPQSTHPVHDPRRPTVIQHTQLKQDVVTPPPAHHHKGYGPAHHMRHGAPLAQPPPAGIKRPYHFISSSNLPTQALTTPPTAHNSKISSSLYIRELDPYSNSVKRPHLQNSRDPVFPSSATSSGHHRVHKPPPSNIDSKVVIDDMPTDLSMKRSSVNASASVLNFSTTQNASQGQASCGSDEGPLNLVTHRRAPEIPPSPAPPPPLPSAGKAEEKRLVILNHSPMALTSDNHSKVPKELSASSPKSRVSPRTIGPDNTIMSSRPLSRASPQVSPRPSSHPSSNMSPRVTPGSQPRAQSPGERYWTSPQGATPVTASPDAGAASIHPAFPSTSLHLMPGLLPPSIRPHVFYEAQLRATQSPRQAPEGATASLPLAPTKQTLTEQRK